MAKAQTHRPNYYKNRVTPQEQLFIKYYIKCGNGVEALKQMGVKLDHDYQYQRMSTRMLTDPIVLKEMDRIMEEARNESIMDATEVMRFYTAVARGEVKDQFGLDAPLSERLKAANEIAKRTADIELKEKMRKEALDAPVVAIKLLRE